MTLAKLRDRAEIRRVETDDAHEVDVLPAGLGDPPRRVDPVAITVESKRRHHRRIERRLPPIDAIDPLDRLHTDLLDRQVHDEPHQAILVDELLNRRRNSIGSPILQGRQRLLMRKQDPICRLLASKIRDFSDRLLVSTASR
jgi:hypothetical protein